MAAQKTLVELYYDVISPYSWFAFEILHRYKGLWTKMDLQLCPFNAGKVILGSKNTPLALIPIKAAYARKDINNLRGYYNLPLEIPSNFMDIVFGSGSSNAQLFVAAVHMLANGEKTEDVSRAFFKRLFTNDPAKDIHEIESLKEAGKEAGLSEDVVSKAIENLKTPENEALLSKNNETALKYGAFGAPTIIVHTPTGPEMLFGSDRIEFLAHLIGEKYKGPLADLSVV